VYEEVGLRVHNLQYFGSQSWPFPHSLMIAYTADYLDGEIRVDESEIADARWFGPATRGRRRRSKSRSPPSSSTPTGPAERGEVPAFSIYCRAI
jgi:NADH pyrophosphatase NudC (nudix superfamily)